MGVAKYKINLDFFYTDSEYFYYFLGFIASDGYVSDDRIELALNKRDKHILETFQLLIQPDKPLYEKKKTNAFRFQIDNKDIAKYLKQLLSMSSNNKCTELRFPDIPKQYLKDFIRGYVDGDGTIGTTKGYQREKTYIGPCLRILGNKYFLKQMLEEIRPIIPNKTYAIQKKSGEKIYLITYNFSIANNVLSWLYDDNKICLYRKYQKYLEVTNKMKI